MNNEKLKSTKDIYIVGILSLVFLALLVGMLWDVYGKKLLPSSQTNGQHISQTTMTQTTGDLSPMPTQSTGNQTGKNKPTGQKPATKTNMGTKIDSSVAYSSYSTCLENVKDEPASKDCCDCLSGDAAIHKACRDAAATYDFSKNSTFKTFTITSTLGRNGDYSKCTASGNQQQCKECCEQVPNIFSCGDFQYCRTACNNLAQ